MSGSHYEATNSGSDLQAIIAAKISLREEIKAELRAEFGSLVDSVRSVSHTRYESVQRALDDWRTEVIRQANERAERYQQRFTGIEAALSRVDAANKEVIETRLNAADRAQELLAREQDKRQRISDDLIASMKSAMEASDRAVDDRAHAANNAIEKQLNVAITNNTAIIATRYDTARLALDAAIASATSAIDAVDKKSFMRCESSEQHIKSSEEHLLGRIASLKELIDQRADMGNQAISKAEAATALRFESVNEFRQTLTDQAASFVSRSTLDAMQSQTQTSINGIESQVQIYATGHRDSAAALRAELAGLKSTVMVGGSTIVVVLLVIQLVVNVFGPPHETPGTANSKRLDDLNSQMLQNQRDLGALAAQLQRSAVVPSR